MKIVPALVSLADRWVFPGLDLHNRCRYHFFSRFFRPGPVETLDAGCGNGALSYAAYKRGNKVLGITFNPEETAKARARFSAFGVDPSRLQFRTLNLYNLSELDRTFDQIICSETLEHIRKDSEIVRHFYKLLRPGGVLHLCCPNAMHPQHRLGRVDNPEDGGHVRDGYTLESYRLLLEPAGFEIVKSIGVGSPLLARLDWVLIAVRIRWGDMLALPVFLSMCPLLALDYLDPPMPFSLYVQAVKRLC